MSKTLVFRFTLALGFTNLIITALLGIVLRLHPIVVFSDFNFRFWTHAHSHVAFLGWVFLILIGLIHYYFLPDRRKVNAQILGMVVFFQLTVLGMLFTFPITGYALWSIIFSSLHMFGSFYLAWFIHKHTIFKGQISFKFLSAALWFMIISSIGPLALGPIVAMGLKQTMWYNLAIYFYLHFQYNGWFILAIIAVILVNNESSFLLNYGRRFYRGFVLIVTGICLTYLLSALGYRPPLIMYSIGGIGAFIQLLGFFYLKRAFLNMDNRRHSLLFSVFLVTLIGKLFLQLLSAIPSLTPLAYYNKDIVIAYLHLVLLGTVTTFLLDTVMNMFDNSRCFYNWIVLSFFAGFFITEITLLLRGFQIVQGELVHYALLLGGISILVAAALMTKGVLMKNFKLEYLR